MGVSTLDFVFLPYQLLIYSEAWEEFLQNRSVNKCRHINPWIPCIHCHVLLSSRAACSQMSCQKQTTMFQSHLLIFLLVFYYTFSPLIICYHFYIRHCDLTCLSILQLHASVFCSINYCFTILLYTLYISSYITSSTLSFSFCYAFSSLIIYY